MRLRQTHLNWRDVRGEVVALDARAARYYGINRSGRLLWNALATGASRDELIGLLATEFNLNRDRATSDVDQFLATLRDRDLVADEDESHA